MDSWQRERQGQSPRQELLLGFEEQHKAGVARKRKGDNGRTSS